MSEPISPPKAKTVTRCANLPAEHDAALKKWAYLAGHMNVTRVIIDLIEERMVEEDGANWRDQFAERLAAVPA